MDSRALVLKDGNPAELPAGEGLATAGRDIKAVSAASGTYAPDLKDGGQAVFYLKLSAAVTVGAPTNAPADKEYPFRLYIEADGTNEVTWNAVFDWGGGSAPDVSAMAAGKVVIVTCVTLNGATKVAAMVAQSGFGAMVSFT